MVWMHGGGYTAGSGNDLLSYDGTNLARRGDVVVVTHNHRLNAFGYLNLAELGGYFVAKLPEAGKERVGTGLTFGVRAFSFVLDDRGH